MGFFDESTTQQTITDIDTTVTTTTAEDTRGVASDQAVLATGRSSIDIFAPTIHADPVAVLEPAFAAMEASQAQAYDLAGEAMRSSGDAVFEGLRGGYDLTSQALAGGTETTGEAFDFASELFGVALGGISGGYAGALDAVTGVSSTALEVGTAAVGEASQLIAESRESDTSKLLPLAILAAVIVLIGRF